MTACNIITTICADCLYSHPGYFNLIPVEPDYC